MAPVSVTAVTFTRVRADRRHVIDADTFDCGTCGTRLPIDEAVRSETYGGLDPETWQTLCCPSCGSRLKTVFVGDE